MSTTTEVAAVTVVAGSDADPSPADVVEAVGVVGVVEDPEPLGRLSVAEVVALVAATLEAQPLLTSSGAYVYPRPIHLRATEALLVRLAGFEGTWRQRWAAFEEVSSSARPWWTVLLEPGSAPAHRQFFNRALGVLVHLGLVRPSHGWMWGRHIGFISKLPARLDPEAAEQLAAQLAEMSVVPDTVKTVTYLLGSICANTGRMPRQLSSEDVVAARDLLKQGITARTRSANTLWNAMRALGWFGDIPPVMPQQRLRMARLSIEQHVDRYQIASPQREVLIEYLKTRITMMDYSSFLNLVLFLVGNFWEDIAAHHPDLTDFSLDPVQVEAWKQRLAVRRDGSKRRDLFPTMIAVRGFYLDIADWALTDSYWAQWVTRCPINRYEVRNLKRQGTRTTVARMHQRTLNLTPLLPALIAGAEDFRRETAATLAAAVTAGLGGRLVIDGTEWEIRCVDRGGVRAYAAGKHRYLSNEEDRGFWTWACIEVLRHSAIRLEEMLELTHFAIQPYTVRQTGETIPLVHIPPSKTDEERLIVASPELVHVLTAILSRLRSTEQQVPLTQRWDGHERVLSDPLPHLLIHRWNNQWSVLTPVTVYSLLGKLAERLDLRIDDVAVKFTPHDFRRVFATEALANGMPPHIVQVLLGHKSLATTQGYMAIYPQDVIQAHRSFITNRRRTRPSEEYREPTAEEWAAFEAHFVQRKLSLGSCGRGYGTSCQHEHACLRCGLLRPDPAQIDRLRDIVTNLDARVLEAEENNWLGEVEGLKVSLAGAQDKLAQMQRQIDNRPGQAFLGLPPITPVGGPASTRPTKKAAAR